MTYDVGVVGLDDFNGSKLKHLKGADDCRFRGVITRPETIIHGPDYPFEERLEAARARIGEAGGIDGILTYWDFPSSSIAAALAEEFDVPYASLESVLKCEHKLWFREEQAKVMKTPDFAGFNPFDDDPMAAIHLDYPFWVKPVVGHSSMLGFRIESRADFDRAIEEIRAGIRDLTKPFAYVIERVGLPDHLKEGGADLCVAEEIISDGDQCTVEGYAKDGEVVSYALIDSIRFEDGHTFHHYSYPSRESDEAYARMARESERLIRRLGYDDAPFNIEFFFNREEDRLDILEVNARLSQSHAGLFERVDGRPHFQFALDLALGREPRWDRGGGQFNRAGKFYLRRFEDAIVERTPSDRDVWRMRERYPDAEVETACEEGDRLSELREQAPGNYIYAELFLGADSEDDLMARYEDCLEILGFRFRPVEERRAS
ncbi:MAG: ATP-grasp domain-containing protein [Marivibrio sp.]|uniref:ATP-grasp domain-containing protein n=1 Tax=Marivibrio sp. TaxID=2039719 RepID=UPI0032F05153